MYKLYRTTSDRIFCLSSLRFCSCGNKKIFKAPFWFITGWTLWRTSDVLLSPQKSSKCSFIKGATVFRVTVCVFLLDSSFKSVPSGSSKGSANVPAWGTGATGIFFSLLYHFCGQRFRVGPAEVQTSHMQDEPQSLLRQEA